MDVVMVHGFLNTGRLLRPLCRAVEAHGHTCHAPTFHPRDGRLGLPDLSQKLASFIGEHLAPGAPLALVGFSMGALVVRHYLQALGGARSARAFFSIAGPYRGTMNAYLYPGLGTRQMRPGSAFLESLRAGASALDSVAVFTYRTPFDLMVLPSTGSLIPSAKDLLVWCPFHSLLPRDLHLGNHIVNELAKLEPQAAHRSHAPTQESVI
jgi:triacylglycerol lipase